MIEPDFFTRIRVFVYGAPHRAQPQAISVFPLRVDPVPAPMLFDNAAIVCLKNRAPWKSEAVAEIPHIHPVPGDEALLDARREAGVNPAAVGNRSLSTRVRRSLTKEKDL